MITDTPAFPRPAAAHVGAFPPAGFHAEHGLHGNQMGRRKGSKTPRQPVDLSPEGPPYNVYEVMEALGTSSRQTPHDLTLKGKIHKVHHVHNRSVPGGGDLWDRASVLKYREQLLREALSKWGPPGSR